MRRGGPPTIDRMPSDLRSRHYVLLPFFAFVLGLTWLGVPAPASAALRDWWPFGSKNAADESIPDPVPYSPHIEVKGEGAGLNKKLSDASNLLERQGAPASGLAGLIARARQDVGPLAATLDENGYYAGEISITIDGKPLEAISPFDPIATRPVPVDVNIATGPRFTFGRIRTSELPRGVSLERLGLVTGRPANSTAIVSAENAIADAWREQGHPLAAVKPRNVVADHETRLLDVDLVVDSGPVARFGRVTVTGAENVDRRLIVGRAARRGGQYSSKTTKVATQRLRDLGVFESVRLIPAERIEPDGTIPMTIAVVERKPRVFGGTVFYSNTEGGGVEAYWRHRNLWGGAEQLEVKGAVSRLGIGDFSPDYRLATTLKKPGIFGSPLTDGTLRVEGYRQTTDAYRVTALEHEATISRIFSETITGSLGLEIARSRTDQTVTGTENHLLATLRTKLDWDMRDNRLDPTTGFRAQFLVAPAHDFRNRESFATFGADASYYRAFDPTARLVLAGRAAAYSLTAKDVLDVPADRRIYAGGAGSVRGYGYKNIAPRNNDGDIVGGRSSVLVSAEVRYRLNDQFGLVAFADVGNATARIAPSFSDQKVGLGVGLRYLTPVGPVRLDLAVPLQPESGDPRVAVYVGLGQAF
jgi:translocation and assembly module TamA